MPQNSPKIGFFEFFEKFSSLMCQFFGFKRCTIIVFTILRKPHVREKSGSQIMPKKALGQLEYFWNRMTYQSDFLHVKSYQLLLEIDHGTLV